MSRRRVIGECYTCENPIYHKEDYYKCKTCGRLLHDLPQCWEKYEGADWWYGFHCHCGGKIKVVYYRGLF